MQERPEQPEHRLLGRPPVRLRSIEGNRVSLCQWDVAEEHLAAELSVLCRARARGWHRRVAHALPPAASGIV
jgi:hypothetical protein